MGHYINGALVGMGNAVNDKEYQKKLAERADGLLQGKKSISSADLKKTPLFQDAFKKMDTQAKARFEQIINLDGDAKNISEKELKTLLTVMDADLQNVKGNEKFLMDGNFSLEKSGGLNQATDREIIDVYNNTKTRAEIKAEEIKNMKKASQKLESVRQMIADFDVTTGTGLTQALNTIDEIIDRGDEEGLKLYDMSVSNLFNGQLERFDTYRDGGSREYILKDGTKVFHDNKIFGEENGYVTITHPDKTVEKYTPEGERVE